MANDPPWSDGGDDRQEHLLLEAEELMRQGRYQDAVNRYRDLRRQAPTDPWIYLGQASALECAGKIQEARQVMEEVVAHHRRNANVQRFCHMFYVRREDYTLAQHCLQSLRQSTGLEEDLPDQLAELYFNQGRYHEALAEINRIFAEETVDTDDLRANLFARAGACLRQDGRYDEARERLLAALTLEPGNHWTLSELAETERACGNPEAARRRYHEALAINPDDHWCRGHLAQLEHEDGNSERAISLYEEVIASHPSAIWAQVELAQVLTEIDPERSAALCHEVLQEDASYPWAYTQLAALAKSREDFDAARDFYQQALSTSPQSVWILHELADTCRQMGRMEEAYAHLDHARNQNPFDPTTFGFTADFLRGEGKAVEAIANLRKAVEFDPHYCWAWRELAELYALEGNITDAEAAYAEAERLEPDEPINYGLRAFILRCADRREEAIPYLHRAVAQQPSYHWAWRELAENLLKLHRPERAEEVLEEALGHLPEHRHFYVLLAQTRRHLGKTDQAIQAVDQGLALDGDSAQLWALRAELSLEGDPVTALEWARKAVALNAGKDYRLLLAQACLANGVVQEAAGIISDLVVKENCPAFAWDLAVDISLRREDLESAHSFASQGHDRHSDDPRLLVRLADMERRLGRGPGVERLDVIWEADAGLVPWRDVAVIFAESGRATACRQACDRFVAQAARSPLGAVTAWCFWGEMELRFGHRDAARECFRRSLILDDKAVTPRLMLAMLAEQERDFAAALNLVEDLRTARPDRFAIADTDNLPLIAQLASLQELTGHGEAATELWEALRTREDLPVDIAINGARHLARQGRHRDAFALLVDLDAHENDQTRHRSLIREQALVLLKEQRPIQALHLLEGLADDGISLKLALHICLNLGDTARAATLLAGISLTDADRELRLLAVRVLVARHDLTARVQAERLATEEPQDETAAVLLAQSLAATGAWREALAAIDRDDLPDHAGIERLLVGACLMLEVRSAEACLAWIGRRLDDDDADLPLVRILANAWPGALFTEPQVVATIADLQAVPPYPRCVRRLAGAFIRTGRFELAAHLLHATATTLIQLGHPHNARRLFRLAIPCWIAAGHRRQALRCALAGRSLPGLIRSLLPCAGLLPWPRSLSRN